ncbi:MAG: Crp/Fnr family transcriptional regulator [Moraxella sp.]|nr:Crp/Fnr family transcriptional regulator [Moraxella sp.]
MRKLPDGQKQIYLDKLFCHPMLQLLPHNLTGNNVRESLARKTTFYRHTQGSLVFLQHTPATHLYFLIDGQVSCHRGLPNGQESLIYHYQTLSLINENVLWQHQTPQLPSYAILKSHSKNPKLLLNHGSLHQLTAKTTKPAIIATIPALDYFNHIKVFELGELFTWFASHISKRLYQHLLSSDLLTFYSAKAKVSYYLLTHFSPHEPIVFDTTQKQLANQMGIRAETLSRTLRHLSTQGFIQPKDGGYVILNIDGLLSLINE